MKLNKMQNGQSSLGDGIHLKLRREILTGRIRPGTRLVESAVAKEMGVSRTPVREALRKLESEELVHCIPRVGYMVNDMSEYDIEDLFATRTAIEQLAAGWAVEKISSEEIERLGKNLEKTDRALKNGLTRKMIDLDSEFHEILCRASRSKRVYQISQLLREHMLKFRTICLHLPEIARKARDGHDQIFKAIRSRDSKKLSLAVYSHMEDTKRDIIEYLRRARKEF